MLRFSLSTLVETMAHTATQVVPLTITRLFAAVKNNQVELIENSLTLYGLPRSGTKTTDYLILQTALEKNYRDIAKLLINARCRITPIPTDAGWTPLALALMHEDQEIALMLIKRGVTPYVSNKNTTNILHLAAQRKSLKMLKFASECKIGVNLLDDDKKTALQSLLENYDYTKSNSQVREIEMIRLLLSKGASVDFVSSNSQTALHYVVLLKQQDITKAVLQKLNNVNWRNNQGKTALHVLLSRNCASEDNIFEIVKLFIEKGAIINIADLQKVTVGHLAAEKKYLKIMNMFLQHQCNVKLQDNSGNTILHKLLENSVHLRGQEIFMQTVNSILSVAPLENTKNTFGKTPLHLAADNRHYGILEKMLPKLENINATDGNSETLLHILLKNLSNTNYNIVKRLLTSGANVDMKNASGRTPIGLVMEKRQKNLLFLMISHSKNLNQHKFQHSESILHYLVDYQVNSPREALEIVKIAKRCLAKGANIEAVDDQLRTPLFAAAMNQCKSMVELLLKHGANVNFNSQRTSIIEHLISKSTLSSVDLEIANLLVSRGAGRDVTFNGLLALLKHIDSQESESLMTRLLNNCKNINVTDSSGNTVLHAVLNSNVNTNDALEEKILNNVALLLKKGVSVDARNKEGSTALHLAAKHKHDLVAALLLKSGANISLLDNAGNSVVHYASMDNLETDPNTEKNMIDFFVNKGCNVNPRNKSGMTPLLTAARSGCMNAIRALVSHGADVKCTAGENSSNPLHLAAEHSYHTAFVEYLLECGANVYDKRKDGKTALHVAAAHGGYETLKILLKQKMDPDARDNDGRTALHWACWHGNLDIAMYLLSVGADVNALDNRNVTPLMLSQNSNNALWATLQKHVKRLEIAGVSIPWQNTNCISNYKKRVDTSNLVSVARLEVQKMRETVIDNKITLADVPKMNLNKLVTIRNHSAFKKIVSSEDFHQKFPVYFNIIRSCSLRGAVRRELMEKAKEGFGKFLQLSLPDDCVEEIFKFLNNENLINLIQASQSKVVGRKRVCAGGKECVPLKRVCRVNE